MDDSQLFSQVIEHLGPLWSYLKMGAEEQSRALLKKVGGEAVKISVEKLGNLRNKLLERHSPATLEQSESAAVLLPPEASPINPEERRWLEEVQHLVSELRDLSAQLAAIEPKGAGPSVKIAKVEGQVVFGGVHAETMTFNFGRQ
ncbi:MAG: hypothetical protein HQL80_12035 [Magnetococcales bacterium]|nr:hypothetical protein [Magnetococcales bacterium]